LVARDLKLFVGLLKRLIKHLVETGWATDPDLLQFSSIPNEFALDVLRVPSGLLGGAAVRHPQG